MVFQDTHNIIPGDVFPEMISKEIEDSDVLIVLVSPAWFDSDWCRREFNLFTTKERALAQGPRMLPVLSVHTPNIESPGDDAIAMELAKIQYSDWTKLRHEQWANTELRKSVDELVERVVELGTQVRADHSSLGCAYK